MRHPLTLRGLMIGMLLLVFMRSYAQHWAVEQVAWLPEPVSNNAVCEGFSSAGSFVYSFGGIDSTLGHDGTHLKSWRVNTETLSVDALPDMPDTLGKIASAASRVGNIIYIIGGYHVFPNGDELSSNKVHRFDIAANQFISDGAPIPVPIDDQVQAVWRDSLIYVMAGWSNTGNVPDVQIYDPHFNSWSVGDPVPSNNFYKCFGSSGEIIGDTLFYFGGAAGFNFGAKGWLRKGVINPQNPMEIAWSYTEPDQNVKAYRPAACKTNDGFVHWLGGSSVSYNYDAIAYNGSGPVEPAARYLSWYPEGQLFSTGNSPDLPMDLRGVANISTTEKFIVGGIEAGQTVSDKVLKLTYTSTLSVNEENNQTLFLFPSVTSGVVRIHGIGPTDVTLFDLLGSRIRTYTADQSFLDLSDLPSGTYLAQASTSRGSMTQKIILLK